LSNFFRDTPIVNWDENLWKSTEHYFQAHKTKDPYIREYIRNCDTPADAKRLAGSIEIRKNWDSVKIGIMQEALRMKFDQWPKYKKFLLQTEKYRLIEGNTWHDNFWGSCYCDKCEYINGQNMLGKLLMNLRDYYLMLEGG